MRSASASSLQPQGIFRPVRSGPDAIPRYLLMATETSTITSIQQEETTAVGRLLRKCFSFPVVLGAALVAADFAAERSLRLDPDTWWHIKYGDLILSTGRWPTVDHWSFTAHGMPVLAYEWVGEILTALAYKFGGLRGMDLLLFVLSSIVVLLLYYYTWLRCRNAKAAFLGTLFVFPMAALCFTLRPQMLGYSFLLITLIALERFRQGEQKSLWLLPPLFLLWVNTHGSFVLGFMAMGLYWLGGLVDISADGLQTERWRPSQRIHLELIALLCLAVLPITPYGTQLAVVPVKYAFSLPLNLAHIDEWMPMNLGMWPAKLLLVLLFAWVVAQLAFRMRYQIVDIVFLFLMTYLTFVHFRFVIFYAMFFAPIAASVLARWIPAYDPRIDKHFINAGLILAALGVFAWYFPSQADLEKNVAKDYPVQAVQYMKEHPVPGPMFNNYGFGGYLVWSMAPAHKVFIDGRGDLYEETGVFADYMKVVDINSSALAVLQAYGVRSCIIPPQDALATLLSAAPAWKKIYADRVAAIYVRIVEDPAHANASS